MKNYLALIVVNETKPETGVIEVNARNLTQAKEEAGKVGRVICVSVNKGNAKINF